MKYLAIILLTLSVTANNYYEVVYDTIRGNTSIFQIENHSSRNIYCDLYGDNFEDHPHIYSHSSSRWYITPKNLTVDCST